MRHSKFSLLTPSVWMVVVLFLASCKSEPKFPNCVEKTTCLPAIADNAPESVKKMHETLAGKWKFVNVTTRDTFHKTGATFINKRANACIGFNGAVQYFIDNQQLVCKMCYELKQGKEGVEIVVDKEGQNKFCLESFQSGDIQCAGDSLVVVSRDSFVIKRTLYRRMNDDGTFKTN
ncbi:MAG: hypothetical protein JNL70_19030 [Saprospiraceae bacterium]|nr:hypothetical protein [Saprospiraceae bacterium]